MPPGYLQAPSSTCASLIGQPGAQGPAKYSLTPVEITLLLFQIAQSRVCASLLQDYNNYEIYQMRLNVVI